MIRSSVQASCVVLAIVSSEPTGSSDVETTAPAVEPLSSPTVPHETLSVRIEVNVQLSVNAAMNRAIGQELERRATLELQQSGMLVASASSVLLTIDVAWVSDPSNGGQIATLAIGEGANRLTNSLTCTCGEDELIERLITALHEMVVAFDEQSKLVPVPASPPLATPPDAEPEPTPASSSFPVPARGSLDPLGKTGIGVMTLGGLGIAAGIVLLAIHGRVVDEELAPDADTRTIVTTNNTQTLGVITLVSGFVVTAVGGAMIGVNLHRRKRNRAVAVVPQANRNTVGLLFSGRF